MSDTQRRKELAMIHLAKKELGLDEDLYRLVLKQNCGVESAADLDEQGRRKLLAFFRSKGWSRADHSNGKPHNFNEPSRARLMSKIEALLAEAKRPWSYATVIAKRVCKKDRLAFCTPHELGWIISALTKDAQRHNRPVA
ncbi:MAG: regulatory protein GemA [Candidatus Riflebacteria bacterium]